MEPQTNPPVVQPQSEHPAKTEYDHLLDYFDKLVKYSLLAISVVLALAAAFLWKSTGDVRTEAETAIRRTEDSANRQITDIGKSASDVARAEAQKAIDAAFERQNVQRMIEATAQKKVDAAVEAAVQRNLGARIDAFRNLIAKIGEIANHGAQLRLNFRSGLDALLKERENPDPTVRAYAASTLTEVAADYERAVGFGNPNVVFFPPTVSPKMLMQMIRNAPDQMGPQQIGMAFIEMKKRLHWDVPMFDIPAAEKWCARNKPKCDEDAVPAPQASAPSQPPAKPTP